MLIASLVCLAALFYTYFGYPLLIGVLARLFPTRDHLDPAFEPTVSVFVCAYNSGATLDAKLTSLVAQDYPAAKLEILVYSDASTDDTDAIARRWSERDARVRLIRGEVRAGKPTGLNRMRAEAQGQVVVIADSRQPMVVGAVRALVRRLSDPKIGVATGNLLLEGKTGSGVYWAYENWIRRQESRFRSMVGMTGPLAALRREDLGDLPRDVILDDIWIAMQLRLRGLRTVLVEEAIAYDKAFDDDREYGRKVRTLAGNYQIFALMPALASIFKNPSFFETFSHKVMRLVCPWALIVLFLTSSCGALCSELNQDTRQLLVLLLAAQLAFYLAALAGKFGGRVGSLARTFVVLNWAALQGLWRHLRGTQKITW